MPEPTGPPGQETPDDRPGDRDAGRHRLAAALRKPYSRGQVIAAVLLAVLGFAAAVQLRANGRDEDFAGAREQDLIALINRLSLATDRAEEQISRLERTRDSLRTDADASRTAQELARRQATELGILAGTLPAEGPGIRVVVSDQGGQVGTDLLLNGIEELRDAGAEAIEINDSVRVVAQTAIVDVSPGLLVGGVRVEPPYVIEAIGDPATLASALAFTGGLVDEVEEVGGRAEVQQVEELVIASTVTPDAPEYAEPVPEE